MGSEMCIRDSSYTYAGRCDCPRGRWFARKDAEAARAVEAAREKKERKLERPDLRKLAAGDIE